MNFYMSNNQHIIIIKVVFNGKYKLRYYYTYLIFKQNVDLA